MKQTNKQTDKQPRRRWITIGPGIIIALILTIQIVVANRQKPTAAPIIERQVVNNGVNRKMQPAPEIGYVIEHKKQLALSSNQMKALDVLRLEWQSRSKPLSANMDRAAGEFNAFMKKTGNKATIQEIKSHAGYVSELSREASSLRRIYWEKALQVLNKEQRQVIDKQLSRGYQPKSV
ncbi:MAG: hypothetical protein ACYC0V_03830 [Armatimonadota bacterium]